MLREPCGNYEKLKGSKLFDCVGKERYMYVEWNPTRPSGIVSIFGQPGRALFAEMLKSKVAR